jgi:hypothetical protein
MTTRSEAIWTKWLVLAAARLPVGPVPALATPPTHTAYIDHIGEGVGAVLVERRQNEW